MSIADSVRQVLGELGENPEREGLLKTPDRVEKSLRYLLRGYGEDPNDVVGDAVFHEDCRNMIVVRDIEVYSLCEHHMLPFFGRCHIGYIPRGKIFGVSKLARLVDCFAARLQIQERLTQQIARFVKDKIDAEGVGVVMECRHLCMMMRGVDKQNSQMLTSAVLGSFHDSEATRNEFLQLLQRNI